MHDLSDLLLDERVLPLGPPLRDLRDLFLAEEFFETLVVPLVGREEERQIFDVGFLEGGGQVLHGRLGEVGAEDLRKDEDGVVCRSEVARCVSIVCGRRQKWGEEMEGDEPFLTRCSLVKLKRQDALARFWAMRRPVHMANFVV